MTAPPSDLRSRVLGAVAREPVPPRGANALRRALGFALAFLPMVVFEVFAMGRGGRPLGFMVLNCAGWALLAAAATWGALGRGKSMLGRPSAWLLAIATATPVLLMAVVAAGYLPWPDARGHDCDPLADFFCFDMAIVLALGPLLAFAFARRDSDPVHPTLTGAALGAAAGAWGALAIALHCPVTGMRHIVLGHVAPVVAFAAIGALLGAKVVAVRART